MEETISLKELFDTLKKRWAIILSTLLVATIISGIVSYFVITPEYKSSTQILVSQQNQEDVSLYGSNAVQTNIQLINTYPDIIKSGTILEKVKEELKLDMSVSALASKINVATNQGSLIMTVSVTDTNPKKALQIANKIAEVFKKENEKLMKVDNVSILSLADDQENQSPISPNPPLNITIAAVVGLLIGIGLAFLLEYLDNTVKTEQDIEKLLELPVLGAITTIDENLEAKLRGSNKAQGRRDLLGSK